jgi:uncharacterized protein (TIGR02996 family)
MPDDPAFIRIIAASPDDDAPRLVYADYLDETGDPAKAARAEFIRVQIEKARLVPDTPRWTELWHRDTALLEWARQWRAELPIIKDLQFGGFIRGFIDQVSTNSQCLESNFELVQSAIPLRRLRLLLLDLATAREIARSPELSEIPELEMRAAYGLRSPSILRAFAKRGRWPRLRRLYVPWLPTNDDDVRGTVWRKVWAEFQDAFGDCLVANPTLQFHTWL